jgi:hypothetical protein
MRYVLPMTSRMRLLLIAALALLLVPAVASAGTGLTVREAKRATLAEAERIAEENGGAAEGISAVEVGRCTRRTRTKIVCDAELYIGESSVCTQRVIVVKRRGRVRASRSGTLACTRL